MSFLYVTNDGAKINIDGGVIKITDKDECITTIPKETIDAVGIFGNVQISTQCMKFFLEKGIRVGFYSKTGSYFGNLVSTGHINIKRQKKQLHLSDDQSFSIKIAKRIIEAKINNQLVILRRYLRNTDINCEEEIFQILNSKRKIDSVYTNEQLMGHEGLASRYYFQALSKIIEPEYKFKGRNKRPPKDPFNAMLSFGYTLLMNELYGEIDSHGLNPYAGFLHQDKESHPTLASDMMEEWRAIIVDSAVMSLIQGHEININDFIYNEETGACILNRTAMKIFLNKFEMKLRTEQKYIYDIEGRMSFRRAIWHQISYLVKAIDSEDSSLYHPITIR